MSYTTILHDKRKQLGLSINEYVLAAVIHNLSSTNSKVPGWCYASKKWMAEDLGFSKMTIHNLLNSLEDKGLIIRDEETKYLKASRLWIDTVERIKDSKESLPGVKNLHTDGKESLLGGSKESLHYNNNNNNNRDNIYNKAYILKHKDEIVAKAKEMYKDKDVDKAMFDFIEHITINKKKWSNFKLAFFRWVREDQYNQYAIKQPNYKRLN